MAATIISLSSLPSPSPISESSLESIDTAVLSLRAIMHSLPSIDDDKDEINDSMDLTILHAPYKNHHYIIRHYFKAPRTVKDIMSYLVEKWPFSDCKEKKHYTCHIGKPDSIYDLLLKCDNGDCLTDLNAPLNPIHHFRLIVENHKSEQMPPLLLIHDSSSSSSSTITNNNDIQSVDTRPD